MRDEFPALRPREQAIANAAIVAQATIERYRYALRMIADESHAPHLTPVEVAAAALEEPDGDA